MTLSKTTLSQFSLALLGLIAASLSWAFTATTGDVGFEVSDFIMNDILEGPAGMVGGAIAILFGGVMLFRSWLWAAVGFILAGVIFNAEAITTAMGYVI